ncbi:MAG: flexitail domain-containing putative surface protein [Dehalococcoidia bacterium]
MRLRGALLLVALAVMAAASLVPSSAPGRVAAAGVAEISTGGSHTCAVTSMGVAKCWGKNDDGELGDNTLTDRPTPGNVAGLTLGVAAIGAGGDQSCAVRSNGGVRCWGFNRYGQLGTGTTTMSASPLDVSGLGSGVASVAAGFAHTCARTTAGGAKCWGRNDLGQLGATSSDTCQALACSTTPIDVTGLSTGVQALALGDSHTCALISGGTVKCWGSNNAGQLGDGTQTQRPTPVDVSGLTGVTAIAAGAFHTCAFVSLGSIYCWGLDAFGQLGDGGATDFSATPVLVPALDDAALAVTAGAYHTCAIDSLNAVRCWGRNDVGQLGAPSSDVCQVAQAYACSTAPIPNGVTGASKLGGGGSAFHTCAVLSTGAARCWGYNSRGQVGDGTTTNATTPRDVFGFGAAPDSDGDGCTNAQEDGPTATLGGQRDGKNFWDFFDTPAGANVRDGAVTSGDLARVVARFGANGSAALDPLSPPPASGYHTAFDRTPSTPNVWNLGPPNASITAQDIALIVGQFGHTCV